MERILKCNRRLVMSRGCDIINRTPDRFQKSIRYNKYLDMQCEKRFIAALDTIIDIFHDDSNTEECYAITYASYWEKGQDKLYAGASGNNNAYARQVNDYKNKNYPNVGVVIKFKNPHYSNVLRGLPSIGINACHNYSYAKLITRHNISDVINRLKRLTRDNRINNIKL